MATVKTLREEAKALEIKGYSKMNKSQLEIAIESARKASETETTNTPATSNETSTSTTAKGNETMKKNETSKKTTSNTKTSTSKKTSAKASSKSKTSKKTEKTSTSTSAPKKQEDKERKIEFSYYQLVNPKRVHTLADGSKTRFTTTEVVLTKNSITIPNLVCYKGFTEELERALNLRTYAKVKASIEDLKGKKDKTEADEVQLEELKSAQKTMLGAKCFTVGECFDSYVEMWASHLFNEEYQFAMLSSMMTGFKSIVNSLEEIFPALFNGKQVQLSAEALDYLKETGLVATMSKSVRKAFEESDYLSMKDKKLNTFPVKRLETLIQCGFSCDKGAKQKKHWATTNGKKTTTKPLSDIMLVWALEKAPVFAIMN